jgi:hypothetical protein
MFFKKYLPNPSQLKNKRPGNKNLGCFNNKHMFKVLNSFLGIIVLIVLMRWVLPSETSELANQILIKVLTLINDLLQQVNLPQ